MTQNKQQDPIEDEGPGVRDLPRVAALDEIDHGADQRERRSDDEQSCHGEVDRALGAPDAPFECLDAAAGGRRGSIRTGQGIERSDRVFSSFRMRTMSRCSRSSTHVRRASHPHVHVEAGAYACPQQPRSRRSSARA